MADNPQDIIIDVEADASQATRASRAVAEELAKVVNNVAQLETKLRNILSGRLPKEMEQLAEYLKLIQTVGNLPANISSTSRVARSLASGGPQTQLNQAAFQGAVAGLRNDPAVQTLKFEQEYNKVLEARATIYRRIRDVLPSDASEPMRTKAYRQALTALGAPVDNAKTLREVRNFEAAIVDEVQTANMKILRAEAEMENKRFDQQQAAAARRIRAEAEAENRRFDQLQALKAKRLVADAEDENRQRDRFAQLQMAQARREAEAENRLRSRPTAQQRTEASLQSIQDRFNYNGGAGMFGVQATILRNYATMAAVLGTASFVGHQAVEFEAAMKDVQAISTSTNMEMKNLQKSIFAVGTTTKLSTKDISDGAKTLAQAGYSVQQIQQMIKPIADLAVGSGSSFADAANVTTSILSAFDLSVSRTSEVTNTLVAGLNQSKLSMEQLSLGIQYAGNIASSGGVQFEEMVAALGAMANAGIKSGSTLGTGLRMIIQQLEAPTAKLKAQLQKVGLSTEDVDIKTHGLVEVLKTLKTAGFDSTAAMASMETRAAAAYTALSGNLNVFEDLEQNIRNTTAAQDAAATQMESFAAQWQRLLNAVTQFATTTGGPVLQTLAAVVGALASAASASSLLAAPLQFIVSLFTALVAVKTAQYLSGLVVGLLGARDALVMFNLAAIFAARTTEELTVAIGALLAETGIGLLIVGTVALAAALSQATNSQARLKAQLEEHKAKAHEAAAQTAEYQQKVRELDKYIESLTNRHTILAEKTGLAAQEAEKAQARFGSWGLSLDASGKHVDGLIFKVVQLRSQMAALAREQALKERKELQEQGKTLDKQIQDQAPSTATSARALLLQHGRTLQPNERAALAAIARGNLSSSDLLNNQAILRGAANRLGSNGGWLNSYIDRQLQPLVGFAVQRQSVTTQLGQNGETIATANISGSQQGQGAYIAAQGMFSAWQDAEAKINLENDPAKKLKLQTELEARQKTDLAGLQQRLRDLAKEQAQDPEVRSGLARRAQLNGTTIEQEIENQFSTDIPHLAGMMSAAGQPNAMDDKALTDAAKKWEQKALTAKKAGDLKAYKKYRKQAKAFRTQAATAKLMKGDEDPATIDQRIQDENDAFDEQTKRGLMGSPGRGRSAAKRTAEADAKALERQIEVTAANLGPTPDDLMKGQEQLKALVDKWEAAKRKAISLGGGDKAEIEQQLADFDETAKQFRDKVLNGNIQAAKDLLAKYAEQRAGAVSSQSAAEVARGTKSLDEALADVQASFNDAMQAAIEASDQEFRAKGFNPTTAHEAVEARRKIMEDFLQKTLAAANDQLQAASDYIARQQLGIDEKRGHIAALSNYYGSRNISDVRRYLGGVQNQKLDIDQARLDVLDNQNKLNVANFGVRAAKSALDADPANEQLKQNLAVAQANADKMAMALERSQTALRNMTEESAPFASLTEAATASWEAFADQAKLNQPVFEQIADGLTGVFGQVQQGFGNLVTSVLTGSKSMGSAFKDFTLMVLQSLVEMAAKIIANKILVWVVTTLLRAAGGGAGGGTAGAADITESPIQFASQGYAPPFVRMAQGTTAAPFRDSMPAMLMPGEGVLNKSAMFMLGTENVRRMNAMGNRRMGDMPTLSDAMSREPDQVNVWVVSPDTKPPVSKKDIIAVIADDVLKGGQTKQLIKQVAMGAG